MVKGSGCDGKNVSGFIDAHIHLESSLVTPTEFVRAVLLTARPPLLPDPHEIANVMGTDGSGILAAQATEGLPIDAWFLPCVPATRLTSQAMCSITERLTYIQFLTNILECKALQMMNYVSTVAADEQVVER